MKRILLVLLAVLLLAGRWWGSIFGMTLGGLLISVGRIGNSTVSVLVGTAVFIYYIVVGILCLKDARKKV